MKRWSAWAALAVISLSAASATAGELVYGSWLGAKSSTNAIALPPYFEAIRQATNGEIDWQLLAGGQLVSGPGTVAGVKDGLIDAGVAMAPYTPKDLPATNLIFNSLVFGNDVIAAAGAMNEAVLLRCAECLEEYQRNNAVGLMGYATSPYLLMCRRPINTVADLTGVKVRSSGGGVNLMQIAGATPVAMNPAEATTALERGALDCVLGSVSWLRNYGYMDVTEHVLSYPLGMGGPPILMYVNRDVWQGMTPEQRQAHLDHAAELVAVEVIEAQLKFDQEVIAEAKAKGITFADGGDDFAAIVEQRAKAQRAENIAVAKEHGVRDPAAIVDAFDAALKKWQGLSPEIGLDTAKFAAALQREVFDKLDPAKL